jgi:ATP-dependent RNA helicase DeaD
MTTPVESFSQLGLSPLLLQALADVGYETPSPIQAQCIPVLLEGADMIGMAQTGTGKTAAFALPALQRVDLSMARPQVLVLTPTRELAIQVSEAFQSYAKHLQGFNVLPIYGGQSYGIQLKQLARGAHIIVGTPGRVMDHLERQTLNLDHLQTLILDEADEMLRMGFIDDVEWILEHTPAQHQTALFSATMPDQIRRVAQKYLTEPREVKIKSATATVAAIRQRYWQVSGMHKLDALTRILEVEEGFDAAIVFVRTKTATVELAEKLEARGYAAAALNGDMNQQMRERAIDQLKNGSLDIVIATDVAARGIDVPRISHVINYDIPYDAEAYVHRIGRTGRAGRVGTAILFVAPREMRMLRTIERVTRQPIEPLPMPTRQAVTDRRITLFKERVAAVLTAEDLAFFEEIVTNIEDEQNIGAREIAAALAFLVQQERPLRVKEKEMPDAPPPFVRRDDARPPREGGERPRFEGGERPRFERPAFEREERTPRFERNERPAAGMATYRIEVGREHGVMPKDIVGAIANEAGLPSRLIGRIVLQDDHSTVDLPEDLSRETLQTLKRVWVRQQQLNISRPGEEAPPLRDVRKERRPAPFGGERETRKPHGDKSFSASPFARDPARETPRDPRDTPPRERDSGDHTLHRKPTPGGKPFGAAPGRKPAWKGGHSDKPAYAGKGKKRDS